MMLPLAREFAQFGIRVNTIAPGIFMTPMLAGMPEEVRDSLGQQIPFPPRLGRPEEYADTAAFIYGNPVVNGETIRIEAGRELRPYVEVRAGLDALINRAVYYRLAELAVETPDGYGVWSSGKFFLLQ
jgi:hypothetical protein